MFADSDLAKFISIVFYFFRLSSWSFSRLSFLDPSLVFNLSDLSLALFPSGSTAGEALALASWRCKIDRTT